MNFLNDSFKSLKNALEEKINFEEETSETLKSTTKDENDNLKKLCQHQLEEVNAQHIYWSSRHKGA